MDPLYSFYLRNESGEDDPPTVYIEIDGEVLVEVFEEPRRVDGEWKPGTFATFLLDLLNSQESVPEPDDPLFDDE
jgi:hypothetical protein